MGRGNEILPLKIKNNYNIVQNNINKDLLWSATGASNAFDIQNVATHEAGHTVSLSDLRPWKDGLLTMYACTTEGEIVKRTLGLGDKLGINDLYS